MGRIIFFLKDAINFAIRMFFLQLNNGTECVICGKKTWYFNVCKECLHGYFSVENALSVKRCLICGKELFSKNEICSQCYENQILKHTDFVLPLYSYRLWNKQLMFLWKKKDVRSLSYLFAKLTAETLKRIGVKVIVPVPPRPGKIQENGWDQIDELCNYLRWYFGFELFNVLERKTVSEQKKLDRKERLDTIEHAYSVCSGRKFNRVLKKFENVVPREVCIIDDVSTTGATLESCAAKLKELGIEKVDAVTLFIVD